MKWHLDGLPDRRVFFITDKEEKVVISFDESVQMSDISSDTAIHVSIVSCQYCKDGKYIRQTRNAEGNTTYSFFHITLEDENCMRHCLVGQIVVEKGYTWSDGVESVMIELLEGISVHEMENGS